MGSLIIMDIVLAAAGGLLLGYGAALMSGFFPLGAAAFPLPRTFGRGVVLVTAAVLALLIPLLLGFVFAAANWAPALIAAGLALLSGPLLFQALPAEPATGAPGLALVFTLTAALCALLLWRLVT